MKKVINFSKCFIPCAILSCVLIAFGIAGFFIKHINFGIDFKPGLIEEIRIAPVALDVTYNGNAKTTIDFERDHVDVVISGTGAENQTKSFVYSSYPTVKELSDALNTVEGLSSVVRADGDVSSYSIFVNSSVSTQLTKDAFRVYAKNLDVSIDEVRAALEGVKGISLKALGTGEKKSIQIRMAADSEEDSSAALQKAIFEKLGETFGAEKIAVIKTDFIGSSFSKTLASKSAVLMLLTVLLIWVYAAIRFHWDFALGSVIALIHDTLIMFTFIIWTQMEFTTTVLAAVLTIVGYSINATVVILDRARFNLKTVKVNTFNELLNVSLSDTLSRSIITTVTTLFAVLSLYIFTTGSIKDFALAMMVGLLSGAYSSIFISSGFISLFRRNWKPEFGIHHSEKAMKKGVLDMEGGVNVD
ncbi:MAG: protein translocase subunit SecF [Treponema sp.]|nr:protein translocase subunit SecF [Treponema sp.]